ncbi:M23 family metallopeptidase [Spirulina subsalsa FACHB-351]|uniref:M23 family metallopeptidase n=1 Tax=Spirulina subsalsa FACHB-351 TaxID=234711 RepID=A0ABT3L9N6_9CYAN|nr:M23 family metallopeptidase [Spirulina subsalsa]MCW6038221.1 M23 family metallopeptidase [Spirulina subsalsa FACHB-351]
MSSYLNPSLSALLALPFLLLPSPSLAQESVCPEPVLSRLRRHTVTPQDTLEAIAQQYRILSDVIIYFNPSLRQGRLPVGQELLIPPLNGISITPPKVATWESIAQAYGVRADVLFEMNGCQPPGETVFIPGINWADPNNPTPNYTGLAGSPLPQPLTPGLAYGWRENPQTQQQTFHSGLDLLAPLNTPVLAADQGVVVFAGQQGNYGNVVIINHEGSLQTRYAHLGAIFVSTGQTVNTGDTLGTVGNTGRPDIDEPHLHFEVRSQSPIGWVAQDPALHFPSAAQNLLGELGF